MTITATTLRQLIDAIPNPPPADWVRARCAALASGRSDDLGQSASARALDIDERWLRRVCAGKPISAGNGKTKIPTMARTDAIALAVLAALAEAERR